MVMHEVLNRDGWMGVDEKAQNVDGWDGMGWSG